MDGPITQHTESQHTYLHFGTGKITRELERGTKITRCRDELIGYVFVLFAYVYMEERGTRILKCVWGSEGKLRRHSSPLCCLKQGLLFAPVQVMLVDLRRILLFLHPVPS